MQERRKPIRRIVQKDPFGSGIACVAMLAGKSYGAVRKEMFPDGVMPRTTTGDLKLALAAYGLEPAHHPVPFRSTSYEDLKDTAILKVNPRKADRRTQNSVRQFVMFTVIEALQLIENMVVFRVRQF